MFLDKLLAAMHTNRSMICVGLDPDYAHLPAHLPRTADGIISFNRALIEATSDLVCAFKPNIAFYEALGRDGWRVLDATLRAIPACIPTILDAKRGDIGSTAEGYARAYLGPDAQVSCDCITINPYLGLDSLEPFAAMAQNQGKGIAVLVRTSNPGAQDFQDLPVNGAPLWTRVGEKLQTLEARLLGQSGFSSLMVVCGATWPQDARTLRSILPKSLFLVPGYGTQGGGARDALAGLIPGLNGHEGGVVSSSRGILYPKASAQAASLQMWRSTFDENLQQNLADLRAASEAVI